MSHTTLTFFEQSLINHERHTCHTKIRQLITRIATYLAFSSDSMIELSNYGLIPILSLNDRENILKELEASIPILNFKTFTFPIQLSCPSQQIFIKLGTGNRINHCHIIFTLRKKQENSPIIATCQLDGTKLLDNNWALFTFHAPIPTGEYIGEITSPDADNQVNALFIWLTVPYRTQTHNLGYYRYQTSDMAELQLKMEKLTHNDLITLVLYIIDQTELADCLESIFNQIYPHWELYIIVGKGIVLPSFSQKYQNKVKIITIANTAAIPSLYYRLFKNFSSQWVVLLTSAIHLTNDALLSLLSHVHEATTPIDMLYSDEDCVEHKNHYLQPYFKPNWSKELLKGQFYLGQLILYRTDLLKQIDNNSENVPYTTLLWDIALKVTEKNQAIQHIPSVLCHVAQSNESAQLIDSLSIVQMALDRENLGGKVELNPVIPTSYLLSYPIVAHPLVSIIIPIRDKIELLITCINSILAITHYTNYEFIIVDNGSQATETFTTLDHYQQQLGQRLTIVRQETAFNFSRLVNTGVQQANGEIILLLNNDMRLLTSPNWLETMIGFAQHPEIGAVGCKLLYPQDNTIQHAGIVCGIGGVANHPHRHYSCESVGYFNRLAVVANYSAVTGACLMVERQLWESVGGFDEHLAIAFNDIDFCLKLSENGLRHVVVPQVIFYHYESKTRGLDNSDEKQHRLQQERDYLTQRWQDKIQHDPFYNPHLTPYTEDFSLNPHSIYYYANVDQLL